MCVCVCVTATMCVGACQLALPNVVFVKLFCDFVWFVCVCVFYITLALYVLM